MSEHDCGQEWTALSVVTPQATLTTRGRCICGRDLAPAVLLNSLVKRIQQLEVDMMALAAQKSEPPPPAIEISLQQRSLLQQDIARRLQEQGLAQQRTGSTPYTAGNRYPSTNEFARWVSDNTNSNE